MGPQSRGNVACLINRKLYFGVCLYIFFFHSHFAQKLHFEKKQQHHQLVGSYSQHQKR